MHILVTNDDGYNAPGIRYAYDLAHKIAGKSGRVTVIAPHTERSGVSHAITLSSPIAFQKLREDHYSVEGYPADCVLLALDLLGRKPDLVISGVNRGHNLGPDLLYSGTVGACIEATAHGVPAIALSQQYGLDMSDEELFEPARSYALKAISPVLENYMQSWPQGRFLNVNFPNVRAKDVKGIKICNADPLQSTKLRALPKESPHGHPYYWLGYTGKIEAQTSNGDVQAIHDGYVAVSFCKLDLSDRDENESLKELFGQ